MDARNDMMKRLKSRRQGFSLEQPFYTDSDYFKLDMELIWYRDWLFAGHDCELPKPGSYMTMQVGDYPVVLVRDQKGQINAFHNSCRHRGSRVCNTDRGAAAKLVCPYHQWTYELDGRLLFARQMAEGFDKSQFGLKPVACESIGGYIFICLAGEPADFAPMRKMIEPYLLPHRLHEAKVAFESTIVERGNWKLVWENNRECYHLRGKPSRALQDVSRGADGDWRQRRRPRPGDVGALGEMRGGRPAEQVPHRPRRPVSRDASAAAARRRQLHHDRQAGG